MADGLVNGLDAPTTLVRVKVGASEYEPRWSFLTEYLLSSRGLTLQEVLHEVNSRGKRSAVCVMELLSACIAHHFPSGASPSAETLAREVGPAQYWPIWNALLEAGRASAYIVNVPKNAPAPIQAPSPEKPPQE